MSNSSLIEKLDKATDKAVSIAISRGIPLTVAKKSTLIGNTIVQKNRKGFYDIKTLDNNIIFSDISVFDVAVIISQRYNSGEKSIIKRVLALEEKYFKYHSDMIYYLNSLRGAVKHNDKERIAILEDKFQVAEMLAKKIRDDISIFKRTK